MKPAALALFLALSGCAVGRVRPDQVEGAALGHAKLEACVRGAEDDDLAMCTETKERCLTLKGGNLSIGAADMIGTALTGLFAWLAPVP